MDDKQPENSCNPSRDLPPEMMEKILKYLPLKDLLSCRLVWKDHDAIMNGLIGKKMKPILFNVKNEGLRDHLKNNPNSPVPDELHLELTFEEDHETVKEICENLRGKIKHLKIDMNKDYAEDEETQKIIKDRIKRRTQQFNGANARLLVQVLETLGGSLVTLEFGLFKSGFYQIANGLGRKSCVAGKFNFPSLRKINIFGKPQEGKSAEKISLWNRLIFKYSGKLESVKISVSSKEVNVLKDLNEVGRLTQITSIQLLQVEEGRDLDLDVLLEYESCGGLQIEELVIKRISGGEDGRLERVLKMQSKKLKKFSLFDKNLKDLKIPVMEQLTSLQIFGGQYRLENICFNKITTPNLKTLTILTTQGSEKLALHVIAVPCKLELIQFQTMIIRGNKIPLEVGLSEILGKKFPSITSLHLENPSEEFVKKLKTAWSNLRILGLKICKELKNSDQSLSKSLIGGKLWTRKPSSRGLSFNPRRFLKSRVSDAATSNFYEEDIYELFGLRSPPTKM